MPYIVTTKRPDNRRWSASLWLVSRRAVATLDGYDIWCALYGIDIPSREVTVRQLVALPESGGTVALPDGMMIEVARANMLPAEIDAFNSREARS